VSAREPNLGRGCSYKGVRLRRIALNKMRVVRQVRGSYAFRGSGAHAPWDHAHARLDYSKLGLRLAGEQVEASLVKVDNGRPKCGLAL
jgi:hypothetical protein